MYIYIERHK